MKSLMLILFVTVHVMTVTVPSTDGAAIVNQEGEQLLQYYWCPTAANLTAFQCLYEGTVEAKCQYETSLTCICPEGLRCEPDFLYKGTQMEKCFLFCKGLPSVDGKPKMYQEFNENMLKNGQ